MDDHIDVDSEFDSLVAGIELSADPAPVDESTPGVYPTPDGVAVVLPDSIRQLFGAALVYARTELESGVGAVNDRLVPPTYDDDVADAPEIDDTFVRDEHLAATDAVLSNLDATRLDRAEALVWMRAAAEAKCALTAQFGVVTVDDYEALAVNVPELAEIVRVMTALSASFAEALAG